MALSWKPLESRGVGIRALNASFDTTPAGRAFLQIQAASAEMERSLIRQRLNEGLAAARARGRKGGRPHVMTLERLHFARHLMADQPRSIPAICHQLGDMPASTLYHYLHADGSIRLLDVSRIESGNLRLVPSAIDLSSLVRSVAQRYDVLANRTDSPLELDIEDGIKGVLDRLAVEQVIENLLSNALKFGIGEPVTLRLRSDRQSARLDVQDRGVGMSPNQQARLFGRFEQVVAQHRGGGFGVGLWLANRLIMAMEGRIDVASCVGKGSTFSVTLPLTPSHSDWTTHRAA